MSTFSASGNFKTNVINPPHFLKNTHKEPTVRGRVQNLHRNDPGGDGIRIRCEDDHTQLRNYWLGRSLPAAGGDSSACMFVLDRSAFSSGPSS